ncbi:MAG: PLP-dependent aminotransferase family protein [Rhodocyclaceae bacterium]|nr:PLP-dependent aminotransferase family protein [Rhodocyclaceae bacterium]
MLNQILIDSERPQPLVEQIVAAIRNRIDDRILRPGVRLPPIRRFAEAQGVSRFTVVEAYDRLVAQGYLDSRRGSGFYVCARPLPEPEGEDLERVERAIDAAWLMREISSESEDRVMAASGSLPVAWMEGDAVMRKLRQLARDPQARVTSYGTPQGFAPLREQLQLRLAECGVRAQPSQIVLTYGATQALDLVARFFLKTGDAVLVDDPGYWNVFSSFRLQGFRLLGVPRLADGPDFDALEAILSRDKPRIYFTQSVLHNPTSSCLSPAAAFRLLQLAERHDLLLVDDDIYGDMHAGSATRLASLDQLQRVIHVGSYSKTISGNLRVGFLAARADLARQLTDVKITTTLTSPEFAERMVHAMLTEGHYRKYVERLQTRLLRATERCCRMLERLGMTTDFDPVGGQFVWARMPGLRDTTALARRALEHGIVLAPGSVFRANGQPSEYLRFNVATSCQPRLERFVAENLAQVG